MNLCIIKSFFGSQFRCHPRPGRQAKDYSFPQFSPSNSLIGNINTISHQANFHLMKPVSKGLETIVLFWNTKGSLNSLLYHSLFPLFCLFF